jgi:hypothetical protein
MVNARSESTQPRKISRVIGGMPSCPSADGVKTTMCVGLPMKAPQICPTMPVMLANHPSVSGAMTAMGMLMPFAP